MEKSNAGWWSVTGCLAAGAVTLSAYYLWKITRIYKTFEKMGVPGPKPWPIFDNMVDIMKVGFADVIERDRKLYGKVYGVYLATTPTLFVGDLDLLRDIMVKKFHCFPNRSDRKVTTRPWKYILTQLRDDHWKHVRSALSPTFSSGKIKRMIPAIQSVASRLGDYLEAKAANGEAVELHKLCGRFSMDVIAAAVFGIDVDSINNPDEQFVRHAYNLLNPSMLTIILRFVPLFNRLIMKTGAIADSTQFFLNVIDASLKDHRDTSSKRGSDFLTLMMESEKEGGRGGPVDAEIDHADQLKTSSQWTRKGLTTEEIESNVTIFLLAGYQTVATVMSFTLFCLANNPECLKKAQQEVDEKLGKDTVTYETANELTYLEMCISETLRLYPPGFVLQRETGQDVEIGGMSIKKGMAILIPVKTIHMDPDIYPEPAKFDPQRFTAEARASRHSMAYMPFGLGPRNCIGMRLAQVEVRMALATALQHCTPAVCDKTVYPPKLEKLKMEVAGGAWIRLEPRSS